VKIHIRTLGCKMNWLDSARLGAALQQAGHQLVDTAEDADSVVVNSCTVTAEADRKSRKLTHAAERLGKATVVTGCGPRANPVQWHDRVPDSTVLGQDADLLRHFGVEHDDQPFPVSSRTRLPVAIQTGCDDQCSFCITRIARGSHISHPIAKLVAHVREACELGIREIVLTGINLAAWGADNSLNPQAARLHELLQALLADTDIARIRLSSLGPQYLQPEFFQVLENPRICDHMHLSIQSGSPSVLARMQRGHDAGQIYRVAEQARSVRPDIALTSDFIAGFPGETDAEHAETMAMVERIGFAQLHVFPFSPREGTPAAGLPGQVHGGIKKQRAAALRELGKRCRQAFLQTQMGKTVQVLVETRERGLSGNYIRLAVPGGSEGSIHEVRVQTDNILQ
jgi:threonylcarbamoyladenosine tRNA methylthiotransferase MtaB